jgi:glycosyltransferase involved in cell wall biosynthesis
VAVPTETAALATKALGYDQPITVISNGVDTNRFSPAEGDGDSTSVMELRRSLGLDSRPVILYTGRLDAEKQMDVWLRAVAQLSQQIDVQLVVGGNGAALTGLQKLAAELGLRHRLHFIGYLPDEIFPDVYRLASIYFITSPVELQSISTLEAVASGLPVVAVRAGALPELVHQGKNGYLVKSGDWSGAAGALLCLLQNEDAARSFGESSRRISARHRLESTIEEYEHFLCQSGHDSSRACGERNAFVGR